jgi:hypothetical protein
MDGLRAVPPMLSFPGASPNPFRAETDLNFALPKADHVTLKIYNVAGQLVTTLVDGEMPAGPKSVRFRAGTLPPGMYFAALRVGGTMIGRSVILMN